MTIAATSSPGLELPVLRLETLVNLLLAGAVATIGFDFFGQVLSPMLGFASLAPVPLATQTWAVIFGDAYRPGGHLLHFMAGLLAYPIGWAFIWQPLANRLVPNFNAFVSATAYGVALWVFALYFMAHLVAGNPAFLNFTGITWVALAGHILFAWITAAVWNARQSNRL